MARGNLQVFFHRGKPKGAHMARGKCHLTQKKIAFKTEIK